MIHARLRAPRATLLAMVFALAIALLALTAPPASAATTVEECQARLTTLGQHTLDARSSFANPKDVDGLVGKITAAANALSVGKAADANQKLADYQAKLSALTAAPKPKVDLAVAAALSEAAQQVRECIALLGE